MADTSTRRRAVVVQAAGWNAPTVPFAVPSPTTVSRWASRFGPDGVHLFDRGTGLNVLLDELDVGPEHWSRAPRQVSVALTNACDLACSFCYAPKRPAVLDVDRVAAWAVELASAGCLGVGFGGGEPTLYRRLPQLCREITSTTHLALTLTTHGQRWTPKLVRELSGNVHFVRVSIDGVGSVYEQIRGRSFADVSRRVELIASAFPLGVNTVVNSAVLPTLDEVAAFAVSHGALELLLLPQQPTRLLPGADDDVVAALRDWIHGYRGPLRLAIGAAPDSGDLVGLPVADPLPGEVGLRSYAHVDASGWLRRSSYDTDGVPVGTGGVLASLDRLAAIDAGQAGLRGKA